MEKGGLREALCGAGVTRETVLGFADEMRVGLRGTVRRVWGRRGVKVRQRVQTVYEWMYLFCVVDGRRGRLLWSWIDSMKADARGHRSGLVEVVGLSTVVQPAYSPELNPAERVFEEVRRWVEGSIYGSIEEKTEAVNAYLRRLESDPGRVRSLAGWDWIEEAVQGLPSCHAASSD